MANVCLNKKQLMKSVRTYKYPEMGKKSRLIYQSIMSIHWTFYLQSLLKLWNCAVCTNNSPSTPIYIFTLETSFSLRHLRLKLNWYLPRSVSVIWEIFSVNFFTSSKLVGKYKTADSLCVLFAFGRKWGAWETKNSNHANEETKTIKIKNSRHIFKVIFLKNAGFSSDLHTGSMKSLYYFNIESSKS